MRNAKRVGGDLTRSFRKNRRASKNEWISGYLLGDSNQDVQTAFNDELISYLSKSVVSITLFNGDTILFSCSGIAIERERRCLTRFLTTAGLARALDVTNKGHDDLKIQVRHEGTDVYEGFVSECDLDHNFAVVNVHTFLDVQVGPFQCALESLPHGEVLVVGRSAAGEIMAKSVELNGDSTVSEDDEDLESKILEAWEGGPLCSVDGNIVGLSLFLTARRAVFLPWCTILKHLEHYRTSRQNNTGLAQSKNSRAYRFGARPIGEGSNSHPEVHGDFLNQEQLDLDSMGYPKLPPTMLGAGMILVNTFEDTFGDIHGEGVWKKFGKRAASNINRNVVALASFSGEKRFFACTGFFIEWNGSMLILTSASLVRDSSDESKIVENLKIEVLLPNRHVEGMLQHYNLHYNVAVVSFKDYRARPSNTLLHWNQSFGVAAVGRCFKSGTLMATSGYLTSSTGELDCQFLTRSTCKITKAGIGGPVVNLDGDVIGMNFFDTKIGTPFLSWMDICKILRSFETKSELGEAGNASGAHFWKMRRDKNKLNRWPVPMPCWCYPDEVQPEDDEFGYESESGNLKYRYIKGRKLLLY